MTAAVTIPERCEADVFRVSLSLRTSENSPLFLPCTKNRNAPSIFFRLGGVGLTENGRVLRWKEESILEVLGTV